MNTNSILPLRLIVTTDCNGKCNFCHKEGACSGHEMPLDLIVSCANIAKKMLVPVTITGGEPTLRKDLDEIIYRIYETAPNIKLGLTTNGLFLRDYSRIKTSLGMINLSIISFDNNIAQQYQKVKPQIALDGLKAFPATSKTLNVVVIKENYLHINTFIDYCISNNYNLDLMFELKNFTKEELDIQKHVLNILEKIGIIKLILKPSPVLEISINRHIKIRVKHPRLSLIPKFDFCHGCVYNEECFERICSLRVYPDGQISPCLKKKIATTGNNDLENRIKEYYNMLIGNMSLLSFIADNPM